MFWKKEAAESEPTAGSSAGPATPAPVSGAAPYAEAALDTVVAMLRALGRYAFNITGVDASAFRRRCEAWAEHLAVGAPHPDGPDDGEPRQASERVRSRPSTGIQAVHLAARRPHAAATMMQQTSAGPRGEGQ